MRKFYLSLISVLLLGFIQGNTALSQSVLNPNDPVVNYDENNPPPTPPYGSIAKWVRTPRMRWNATAFKAYYYNGMAFRLLFPKSYTTNPTKKYPMLIFFHGRGEVAEIYDNELQLYNCGQKIQDSALNGSFDAFVLFPQTASGYWSGYFPKIVDIIDYMADNNRLDKNRISVTGLSLGGMATWQFTLAYPKLVAASVPMSASSTAFDDPDNINTLQDIPIWLSQGGLDQDPPQDLSDAIVDALRNAGLDMRYTVYPTLGHNTWDAHYNDPDAFQYMLRANKTNPHVYFVRQEFCPGTSINVKLELQPGFEGYAWSKNGVIIPNATTNVLMVQDTGTYAARYMENGQWTYWSPQPAVIRYKEPTQTPPIRVSGLMSRLLPAPDGNTGVNLELPEGYASYEWKLQGGTQVLGTSRIFTAPGPGNYIARVTEQFGCSANYSQPFNVGSSTGPNPPDPATNLTGFALSQTSVQLNWSNNLHPTINETAFEIYQATQTGGPYQLVGINPSDSLSFVMKNLTANTKYFYIVRAVDSTGAAAPSQETQVVTEVDSQPPTAPGNLSVTASSGNSISLKWSKSIDNVGIKNYLIYVNGLKSYTTTDTAFTVFNLTQGELYDFVVRATDLAGNLSPASRQVSAPAINTGFSYKVYTGTWSMLPDFNQLTPVKTGSGRNVDISVSNMTVNYGMLWEGQITIPVSGTYTFYTNSDDGSKLYLGTEYSAGASALVNNDGLHATVLQSGTITLTAGVYPIAATFFQKTGGAVMQVYWKAPGMADKALLPDSVLHGSYTPAGTAPAMPTQVKATALSYNKINLIWADNSNNETGFEIYRAGTDGSYSIISTTPANTTAFTDSTAAPSTTYYYKVQAINRYGSSGFDPASASGLLYQYYELSSANTMPDFSALTPTKSGSVSNLTLGVRNRDTYYAIKFSGQIRIPATGQYTFYTKSDDGSQLYIDGFDQSHEVVNNNYLQAATERSGQITLTEGLHSIYITFFQRTGGQYLDASYAGPGINAKQNIPDNAFAGQNTATTLPLPPAPALPDNLKSSALSTDVIQLIWNDNSNNESGFNVYRAEGTNASYRMLTALPANTSSYKDSALFANTRYYYKVEAVNVGGASGFSNEVSAVTKDHIPVMSKISNQTIRYGEPALIDIISKDEDNEVLTLTAVNLPAFGSLTNYGDGTGVLTFNPSQAQQGVYSGIRVKVTDQHGGADSTTFTLTVNDNYTPVIQTVQPITVDAGTSLKDTLTASDQNPGDVLTWTTDGLPSFISATSTPAGKLALNIDPSFNNAGDYSFSAQVDDGKGGIDVTTVTVKVNYKNPITKWYLNFSYQTTAGTPWNNITGVNTSQLINDKGTATNVGLAMQTTWWRAFDQGAVTGDNSGVYPDAVMKDYYYFGIFGGPNVVTSKVTGLDPERTYSLTFFSSSVWSGTPDIGYTVFQAGNGKDSIHAQNNISQTVTLYNLTPAADSSITFTMSKGAGAEGGVLNAMVISTEFDNNNPPSAPSALHLTNIQEGVKAAWTLPLLNNADRIEVYRANNPDSNFVLLNAGALNGHDTTYTDTTVSGNTLYYYTIRSANAYGYSAYTDTVSITTTPANPTILPIADVHISTGSKDTVLIKTQNPGGGTIVLSAQGLPAFAILHDNGNGSGYLALQPGNQDIGSYENISIIATTSQGGQATGHVNIYVQDNSLSFIYLNYTYNGYFEPSPWNNLKFSTSAGVVYRDLSDAIGNPTTVTVKMVNAWSGIANDGATTYNNSGAVPDGVMQTYYRLTDTVTRSMQISGLDTAKRYNFVFFGSSTNYRGSDYTTSYTIGGQTVSLNGLNNTKRTARINGVAPDKNGNITISCKKSAAAYIGLLNALTIESYVNNGQVISPAGLKAVAAGRNKVKLNWVDRAGNETGFEVWRATAMNGTYNKVADVSANAITYTDNGVASNTRYFYKVRAKGIPDPSAYSGIASAITSQFEVYINFNLKEAAAPAPWNNTQRIPADGDVISNLFNDLGQGSGISLQMVKNFAGENNVGVVTGNNSGVYPDLVMQGEYYLDRGFDTVVMKVTGLAISQKYDFTFFGSVAAYPAKLTTLYSINNVSVGLNNTNNSTETVGINNVSPDDAGQITIKIINTADSRYAILGAMVIKAHNNYDDQGTVVYMPDINISTARLRRNEVVPEPSNGFAVQVYPNPFDREVTIKVDNGIADDKVVIRLYGINGELMDIREYPVAKEGAVIRYSPAGSLPAGTFILTVTSEASGKTQSVKLIKK